MGLSTLVQSDSPRWVVAFRSLTVKAPLLDTCRAVASLPMYFASLSLVGFGWTYMLVDRGVLVLYRNDFSCVLLECIHSVASLYLVFFFLFLVLSFEGLDTSSILQK